MDESNSLTKAKIREIITKNLGGDSSSHTYMATNSQTPSHNLEVMQEENRLLAMELNRVEDLLSASRAERDELGIKYSALSDRVSKISVYLYTFHLFVSGIGLWPCWGINKPTSVTKWCVYGEKH